MRSRSISLILSLLLVLLVVLVGILTEFATRDSSRLPPALEPLQRWSVPLLGVTVLLLVAGTVWQHLAEPRPPVTPSWTAKRLPYPGLEAFTEQDAAVFFGRGPQITELVDRLHPTLPRQARRFVAVVGPSGAGKSSLVQAGLLPSLAGRRGRWVVVPPLVPEDQPTTNLARSLAAALPDSQVPDSQVPDNQVETLAAQLAEGPAALVTLAARLRAAHGGRAASVLLVVDQAEELLTLTGAGERAAFLGLLRGALEQDPGLWVVATLRSEFLTGFLETGFAELFQQPVTVGALDRAALPAVIEGPAAQAGLSFAPGLVNHMVEETGGGDALPLLAYTLQALYQRVGAGGTVTDEDYRQIGGVAGALGRQADKVTAELRAANPDAAVIGTLLKFVALDGAGPARRRVQRDSLTGSEREVVDAFIDARLLTSDVAGEDATVQVAHEALFRQWPPLAQAIEARADELRQRAELERCAAEWDRLGHRDGYLLQGERLVIAQQWAAAHSGLGAELPLVHEFVERSTRADRAGLERLADAVARQALADVERDPGHSLLLALAAVQECAPTLLAQQALLAALMASRARAVLRGHEDEIWGVAWSPDGQRLATVSSDRTARIWDAASGEERLVLSSCHERVHGVAWSPDGQRLATASDDGTARIWDAASGEELLALRGHQERMYGLAWSPDGQRLATASSDRTARIWDVARGEGLLVLCGHEDEVWGVAWSPDGQRLATASSDRTARTWDAASGEELLVLRGHQERAYGVAWSPDGECLATASRDRTARVWDAACGEELLVLRGHQDRIYGVAWSPDGEYLATASRDRTARIWDAARGEGLLVLCGHEDEVWGVAWSPDGQRLATASGDRTARVWDAAYGEERLVLSGHQDDVWEVAWSPDGRCLATAADDRTVRIWDAARGEELLVVSVPQNRMYGLAWSPDGQCLATAADDRTARIWDAARGEELLVLRGHQDRVYGVAWSPDGQRLATASRDQTARVWDAVHGEELLVLSGHQDRLYGVAWSPDGKYLVTASRDRTARVWDAKDGTQRAIPCVHADWVTGVAWSPDGQRLATASRDRTARVWDAFTDLEALVAKARQRVFRQLTRDERRRLMLPPEVGS